MTAPAAPRPATGSGLPDAAALAAALASPAAVAGPFHVATLDLPADAPAPLALFAAAAADGTEAFAWLRPAEGISVAGAGRAWAVAAEGPGRFAAAAAAWSALAPALAGVARPAPAGPLLVGGLDFGDAPAAPGDPWAAFGGGALVLPEILLARSPAGTTLTIIVPAHGRPGPVVAAWAGLRARVAVRAAAGDPADAADGARAGWRTAGSLPERAEWERIVGLLAGAVGRGRVDKVVLARRLALVAARPADAGAVVARLATAAGAGAVYAIARSGLTFCGATPERLVRTEGRSFRTVAIAGSAPRGVDAEADAARAAALLRSEKDRQEHAVVVDAIRAALAPLAERIDVAPVPAVLPLRDVQHLATEIAGVLREPAGVLALAGLLHPTPAVAGDPRETALALIAEHEGFDRGGYAGPVGWLAPDGDGELMVALRCGLLSGTRAWLFAGCGIVADSDPAREWEESRMKLRTMLGALGAEEGA